MEFLIIYKNLGYVGYAGNSNDSVSENTDSNIESKRIVIKEVQGVSVISQLPELPSGCEIAAATMLIKWAGVNVDKQDIAKSIPKSSLPANKNGFLQGNSPDDAFIGDPFSDNGLGVYHGPIASVINKYLPDQVKDITGTSFENLLKRIDDGQPIVVWATMNLAEPTLCATWYDVNGKKVKWIAPEHAFLLTGYTDDDVIVNDPYTGRRQLYPKTLFKSRWESLGKQAVTVSDNIHGTVVTTDVTNLEDAKEKYGFVKGDTSNRIQTVKKAEKTINSLSEIDNTNNMHRYIDRLKNVFSKMTDIIYPYYKKWVDKLAL